MGTHPIFESDFDCLTDIGMDSNQNQRKFDWGDPVWVKWPRSPTWPGRIDCIKSDLYKTKQTDPKSQASDLKRRIFALTPMRRTRTHPPCVKFARCVQIISARSRCFPTSFLEILLI